MDNPSSTRFTRFLTAFLIQFLDFCVFGVTTDLTDLFPRKTSVVFIFLHLLFNFILFFPLYNRKMLSICRAHAIKLYQQQQQLAICNKQQQQWDCSSAPRRAAVAASIRRARLLLQGRSNALQGYFYEPNTRRYLCLCACILRVLLGARHPCKMVGSQPVSLGFIQVRYFLFQFCFLHHYFCLCNFHALL